MPTCNCSHARRANSGRITFSGYAYHSFMPSLEDDPQTQGHEILMQKNIVFVAAYS